MFDAWRSAGNLRIKRLDFRTKCPSCRQAGALASPLRTDILKNFEKIPQLFGFFCIYSSGAVTSGLLCGQATAQQVRFSAWQGRY